jgi:hypothetical protein
MSERSKDEQEEAKTILRNLSTMMMMDGPLLTINILLATLRDRAQRDLGCADPSEPMAEEQGLEVIRLMQKQCAASLEPLLLGGFIGMDEIKAFIGGVVDLHNHAVKQKCDCAKCTAERKAKQ